MKNSECFFKFKTNINCNGCIASVEPHLDGVNGISEWNVDITSPDKILTIKSNGITEEEVLHTVQKAGFKIELLHSKN